MLAIFCLQMAKTAQDKRNAGGLRTPAPVPAPEASNATTGALPPPSRSQSVADPSRSVANSQMQVKPPDLAAQYDGTGDPLLLYTPDGGFTDDASILKAIDLVEETPTNSYLSDVRMARIVEVKTLKSVHFQRLSVFQLIVNLINSAQEIVGVSVAITAVKENYERLMNTSLDALHKLNGGQPIGPGSNPGDPTTQKLKRPKVVEVPKFDVSKSGMQTFLNSMSLATKSFKFDSDKDLARYYLNNLTESSKSLIYSIYSMDSPFYESSSAVIKYLESFISPNIGINATNDIRAVKMGSGGLKAYYNSFTRIVADLGAYSMSLDALRLYFIKGLNPDAVHNTNLTLHMHNFLGSNPASTITDLFAEADKVISLTTNSNVLGKRAGPDRGAPRPQWDRGNTQRQQPQQPQAIPRSQRSCSICGNDGHTADRCTSSWSREGKWVGKGRNPQPPTNHWKTKSVKDTKKTAMIHTPLPRYQEPRQQKKPRKPQPTQQHLREQPQPRQHEPRHQMTPTLPKRKKVEFKAQAVTLADLESDLEWQSDSDGSYESAYSYRSFDLIGEEREDSRVVSDNTPLASLGETKRRIPVQERLEQPNTYASRLKGPAPEQSAKPLEPLRFVKRNSNKVKR